MRGLAVGFAVVLATWMARAMAQVVVRDQGFVPFAAAPIHYRSQALSDPVARLQKRLAAGEVSLRFDPGHGYLRSVLQALDVPVNSQTLVFSKTSFQFSKISPAHPRALYFNDDVYVGQVQDGSLVEFIAFDPVQGAIFYVLDEHEAEHPRFERAVLDCVQCHVQASVTRGVPGVMLRSVVTNASGNQVGGTPAYVTGHESPMRERWGGWYVTASEGDPKQMGASGVASLDTLQFLTPHSDIVALLVLAHQTQMHNLITATNYQTRIALHSGAGSQQFERPAEQLVRYLLFADEAPLGGGIAGTSGFAETFAARGPRDPQGRSLRDFDLRTRIFKYPCSYLIYSEAFDAIPEPARTYIYRRLFEVLSGRDQTDEFRALSSADRHAILEILVATKPGVPEEWKQVIAKAP
jgi:hypothetical protein